MSRQLNVNGNASTTLSSDNYDYNDNVIADKYARARKVEEIADTLLVKLRLSQDSRPFMCKVAWRLSEARIWSNLEKAQKPGGRNPVGLFIFLCKRDGV